LRHSDYPDEDSTRIEPDRSEHEPSIRTGAGLCLYVLQDSAICSHELPASGIVRIGRSPECDITIDADSVSRAHIELRIGDDIELVDLGSSNGTRVRGADIPSEQPIRVAPGDVIDFGRVMVIIRPQFRGPTRHVVHDHSYFERRVQEECDRPKRETRQFALLRTRCTSGASGDHLAAKLRATDLATVIGRYGPSDYEFLLVGSQPASDRDVAGIIDWLMQTCPPEAEISWGAAYYPGDGSDASTLLAKANEQLLGQVRAGPTSVIVASPAMVELRRLSARVAQAEINVLILGETGVGKGVLAEHIHQASSRRDKPLVRLCCASLAPTLIESELFGHLRGSFTGATEDRAGLLESAEHGTVFLDEIGELDLTMQTKLLRVIEERVVRRVGSVTSVPIDVRFVAATNRDLEAEVAAGTFRQDLYYRLNGFSLVVPPLRERPEDIAAIAQLVLQEAGSQAGITSCGLDFLQRQSWPGNVRELRNTIERAIILAGGTDIGPEHLRSGGGHIALPPLPFDEVDDELMTLREAVEATERRLIVKTLARVEGNQTEAAKLLGISRQTLIARLDAYALPRPRK
jgi:DNA-binding NtrC family response regulator